MKKENPSIQILSFYYLEDDNKVPIITSVMLRITSKKKFKFPRRSNNYRPKSEFRIKKKKKFYYKIKKILRGYKKI